MKLQLWARTGASLLVAGLALVAVLTTCHGPTTGSTGPSPTSGPVPLPTTDPGPLPTSSWKQATATAAFGLLYRHTSLVFTPSGQTERLWVIGGRGNNGTGQNTVWSSGDGNDWTEETKDTDPSTRFSARDSHSSIVFGDKMWVLGGADESSGYKNDVWSSADGNDWSPVTATAAWSARYNHTSLVFTDPADGTKKCGSWAALVVLVLKKMSMLRPMVKTGSK